MTLTLKTIPNNCIYTLERPYYIDNRGRLWCDADPRGSNSIRLQYCEESGEPSGYISPKITEVVIDGNDVAFAKFNRSTWMWED